MAARLCGGMDPRGSAVDMSLRMEPFVVAVSSARNHELENKFLDEVVAEAARRFNVDAVGFKLAVQRRLQLGASRYGDNDYLNKDLCLEAQEEAWDLGAYSVLEMQKMLN